MEYLMEKMSFSATAVDKILKTPRNFRGDYPETFFMRYFDVLVYFEVLYVLLIVYGPKAMKDRPAYNMKKVTALWNLVLAVFSILGTRSMFFLMGYLVSEYGFYYVNCCVNRHMMYDGEIPFYLYCFMLSKVPEMFDTVLLVLQKKPIIFLHWYHHLTVTIFCWYCGLTVHSSGMWFAFVNYSVHSVMYSYYFLCSCGLRKYIRPIAPFITASQLLQMFFGIGVIIYTVYYRFFSVYGCESADARTLRMGAVMYGSYVFLFGALFSRLYLQPKNDKRKQVVAEAAAMLQTMGELSNNENSYNNKTKSVTTKCKTENSTLNKKVVDGPKEETSNNVQLSAPICIDASTMTVEEGDVMEINSSHISNGHKNGKMNGTRYSNGSSSHENEVKR